ncbi:hypothetical protein BsWGS_28059 [Bradybaena similaris]
MEFLKALEEAKQQGITQEDFVKIWDAEMKLKQQQEEARLLELKLESGKVQDSAKNIQNQVKTMLQKHVKDVQQQISQLKLELQQENNIHFQEMFKQFKSQGAATAMVIRNELENVLSHYALSGNSSYVQQPPYAYDSYHLPTGAVVGSGYQMGHYQQRNPSPDRGSWSLPDDSNQHINDGFFPSEDGAILCVTGLDKLIASSKVTESPVYVLPECNSKVQLSIWFKSKGQLSAQLSVFGDQPLKWPRIFTITGCIENRNSGSYSPLLEGKSQPLKKLRPDKKMLVNILVCLQTGKGNYENVTYEELEKRNYIIDESLIIKWFVTSEDAQLE